ncbi:GM14484 [Drosophila sechellia]|uniref:GM14484 n=1 Tax=Drosophila sechellia TaxID=7238 RepID=B4HW76_DROSE|nr:GM14484 [Drosophila sechellia]
MAGGNNETEPLYCGSGMDNFHTSYKNMHGYVSLVVCILGTIANTLNIIVLTRREMRSPTNAILTGLAVADLAVMLEYIPYTIHDYILTDSLPREEKLSYSWACFIKFHSIFAQVLHTISIWLTVTLAVWRYIAVGYPQKNRVWCGMRTTIITITTAYVVCVLVVSPSLYLITAITEYVDQLDMNGKVINSIPMTQYVIDYRNELLSARAAALNATPTSAPLNETVWLNASSFADIDHHLCTTHAIASALTILSVRLILALLEAKRRRKKLTSKPATPAASNGTKSPANGKAADRPRKNSKTLEKEKQTDRTTRMLLAVLLLFLITEFPQGIMGLLNAVLGDVFYLQCYLRLSDLMDILALINSSINFILYCSMSKQFRTTFTLLFRPKFLDKWLPVAQDEMAAARAERSAVAPVLEKGRQQPQVVMASTTTNITQHRRSRGRRTLLSRLLSVLKRGRRRSSGKGGVGGGGAPLAGNDAVEPAFQAIVVVVDKVSGATENQLYTAEQARIVT